MEKKNLAIFIAVLFCVVISCAMVGSSKADNNAFVPNTAIPQPKTIQKGIIVDHFQDLAANEYFLVAIGRDTIEIAINEPFATAMSHSQMGDEILFKGNEFVDTQYFKNLSAENRNQLTITKK